MSSARRSRGSGSQRPGLVPSNLPPAPWVDLIQADEQKIAALLRVRGGALASSLSNRRRYERVLYREGRVLITLNPESVFLRETIRVMPFDICSDGMRFVHGGFVFPASPCEVYLLSLDAHIYSAAGRVVRCEMLTSSLYDIGVRFETPIPLDRVVFSEDRYPELQWNAEYQNRTG